MLLPNYDLYVTTKPYLLLQRLYLLCREIVEDWENELKCDDALKAEDKRKLYSEFEKTKTLENINNNVRKALSNAESYLKANKVEIFSLQEENESKFQFLFRNG